MISRMSETEKMNWQEFRLTTRLVGGREGGQTLLKGKQRFCFGWENYETCPVLLRVEQGGALPCFELGRPKGRHIVMDDGDCESFIKVLDEIAVSL